MKRLLLLLAVALLPWAVAFGLLKRVARARQGDPEVRTALAVAQRLTRIDDPAAFCFRYALYRLVDDADLAIGVARGAGWGRRWVHWQGPRFPAHGAFVALTFHLGAGLPAWWALGRHDKGVAWIYAMPTPMPTGLALRLARMRLALVERLGGAASIATGGARHKAQAWLEDEGAVMGLIDAPHFGQRKVTDVRLLGERAGLARGLAELALSCAAPVYLYSARLAEDSGRRVVSVRGPVEEESVEALMHRAAAFLDEELRADPAAWHFWVPGVLERGFPPSDEQSRHGA